MSANIVTLRGKGVDQALLKSISKAQNTEKLQLNATLSYLNELKLAVLLQRR